MDSYLSQFDFGIQIRLFNSSIRIAIHGSIVSPVCSMTIKFSRPYFYITLLFLRISNHFFLSGSIRFLVIPIFLKSSSLFLCAAHGILSNRHISVTSNVFFICYEILRYSMPYCGLDNTRRLDNTKKFP